MLEGKWDAVPATLFTANGDAFGKVQVADTAGFRIKMVVGITSSNLPPLALQVKRVLSSTTMILGAVDQKVNQWQQVNLTAYGVANAAAVGSEQQNKNNIPTDDHYRAVYESDPVVADRVIQVDKYGNYYDANNPYPISFDGTVSVGDVSIVDPNTKDPLKVNADGSINVIVESVPSTNSTTVSTYNEVVAVAANATVQLVTYTVPVGMQAVLQRCPVSGDNIARYDLMVDGVTVDTLRTMFGSDQSQMFDFTSGNDSGLILNAGQVVKIQVFNPRPYVGTFEGRIQVLQILM
jgi:hypothetical protein